MSDNHSIGLRDTIGRALDVTLAAAGLLLLSPVFVLITVAIVLENGFPVFYVQKRLGQGGRVFNMFKFRKFGVDSDGGCPLTLKDDTRMTRTGVFLARSKLDELPQLFNILRGDMAVVGPRPESLDLSDCFDEVTRSVLDQRPGIFGPSQVAFRNECNLYPNDRDPVRFYRQTLFPAKAALDLDYYPNRTVRSDLAWIARGVLAVAGIVPPSSTTSGLQPVEAPRGKTTFPAE